MQASEWRVTSLGLPERKKLTKIFQKVRKKVANHHQGNMKGKKSHAGRQMRVIGLLTLTLRVVHA